MEIMAYVQEKITKITGPKNGSINAIELLKADHDKVEELFSRVESTPKGQHRRIFKQIKMELDVHTHIEEKIFYPRLQKEKELKDLTLEAFEEHRQAKMFLREMPRLPEKSDKFHAKLKVLMEDVKHHVKEEENELFPKVESVIDSAELDELGAKMEAEKKRFKKTLAGK